MQVFKYEDLVVDPYWNDLYNPKEKEIKIKKNENKYCNDRL